MGWQRVWKGTGMRRIWLTMCQFRDEKVWKEWEGLVEEEEVARMKERKGKGEGS